MARNHARLLVTIWDDIDWLQLTAIQQITYLSLLSSRDLSWAGVAPLLPQRIAHHAADLTEAKVRAALKVLAGHRFVVVDERTAEVAVRSYVRHDELLKQPNVVKAMIKDLAKVHSEAIREAIGNELRRKYGEEPDLNGWATIKALAPALWHHISEG
jgi:adenosine/AMP kinase